MTALCEVIVKNLTEEILTLGFAPRLIQHEQRFVSAAAGPTCRIGASIYVGDDHGGTAGTQVLKGT
jgi:hypothetical protein